MARKNYVNRTAGGASNGAAPTKNNTKRWPNNDSFVPIKDRHVPIKTYVPKTTVNKSKLPKYGSTGVNVSASKPGASKVSRKRNY